MYIHINIPPPTSHSSDSNFQNGYFTSLLKKGSEREAMKGKMIPFAALAFPATILEWEKRKMDKE